MTSQSYIQFMFMDKQTHLASDLLAQTNAFAFIGQDNCSIHLCKAVKEKRKVGEENGLVLFQLPSYCSEMNQKNLNGNI
jgi:hypothetical protein